MTQPHHPPANAASARALADRLTSIARDLSLLANSGLLDSDSPQQSQPEQHASTSPPPQAKKPARRAKSGNYPGVDSMGRPRATGEKAARLRDYWQRNPDHRPDKAAAACGCSRALACDVRKRMIDSGMLTDGDGNDTDSEAELTSDDDEPPAVAESQPEPPPSVANTTDHLLDDEDFPKKLNTLGRRVKGVASTYPLHDKRLVLPVSIVETLHPELHEQCQAMIRERTAELHARWRPKHERKANHYPNNTITLNPLDTRETLNLPTREHIE